MPDYEPVQAKFQAYEHGLFRLEITEWTEPGVPPPTVDELLNILSYSITKNGERFLMAKVDGDNYLIVHV